ncbi:DENN domain-containing protein 2D-like isoform X2 [Bolinopsis microptera]
MAEPLWPGGPSLYGDHISRPKSKRFSRLDQAQAALAIKDDEGETNECSEIDKRLGLVPSPSEEDRVAQTSIIGGSTGSTTHSSSYTDSTCPSSVEGSVYGGVVLRSVSSTLPRSANSSNISDSSAVTQQDGERGESETNEVFPLKPARERSSTVSFRPDDDELNDLPTSPSNCSSPSSSNKLLRGVSLPSPHNKENKRKRFSSADFLTKNAVNKLKEEKKKNLSGTDQTEQKRKNRISVLYNSMRGSKRREVKESNETEPGKLSSTSEAPDAKTLRLLEEKMCQDPKKLLADRVRELRKVKDPDSPQTPTDVREDFPLFEFVCEVSLRRKSENFCPYISWSHPPLRVLEDDKTASITLSIPQFCFPDMDIVEPVKKMKTETYCFVFTDLQAQNKFGYCRRFLPAAKSNPPEKRFPVVYCMVTKLRSFETFSKIFDHVVHLRDFSSAGAYSFLKALIEQNAPKPGKSVTVKYINPKIGNLVDIHIERVTAGKRFEHVDLAYVLVKLGSKLLVEIFINLLAERKLLFIAENLSDLTTIIHSIMQLLYPLQWQGIYIPVLPQEILDATSSPVPFVIGILKQHAKELDEDALDEECLMVYISEKRYEKRPNFTDIPFNKKFRKKLTLDLKLYKAKIAKAERTSDQTVEIGDMFYEFMRTCIGHYADHVTFDENGESDIDLTSFSDSAGVHSEFVWQLSKTQVFSSFVQGLTPESKNIFDETSDNG